MKKKAISLALTTAILMSYGTTQAFAYGEVTTGSTLTSDTQQINDYKNWKQEFWTGKASDNSGEISIAPGKTEKDLNFAWYSKSKGTPAVKISASQDMKNAEIYKGTAADINRSNMKNTYLASNKVDADGAIKANTTYYYSYTDDIQASDQVWSTPEKYQSHSFNKFQMLLVGDPQIGASGSTGQGTADDIDIAVNTYNWNQTLKQALTTAADSSFILSAGDQIDYSNADKNNIRESEYAGFLYPQVLRNIPLAATIGNHESKGDDYKLHYNTPNDEDHLGSTASGSDYYFSYGNALFIVLNSNNRNMAEHETLMNKAVDSNKNVKWRFVMFHHDIYGSGEPHADVDGANLRILFAPLMDKYKVDVVFNGHDHSYTRTFQTLDGKVIDYGKKSNAANPEGTLYITAGSSTGSKFYNLTTAKQYYVAERSNAQLPTFSTIDLTDNSFTIKTYDCCGNKYADDFTITKSSDKQSLLELINSVNKIDKSLYTESSINRMSEALNNANALLETDNDGVPSELTLNYNESLQGDNPNDPLNYYGYAQANYKDSATQRLKSGYSAFLDKTMDQSQQPVKSSAITEAYVLLSDSIKNLVVKKDSTHLNKTSAYDMTIDIKPWFQCNAGIS